MLNRTLIEIDHLPKWAFSTKEWAKFCLNVDACKDGVYYRYKIVGLKSLLRKS